METSVITQTLVVQLLTPFIRTNGLHNVTSDDIDKAISIANEIQSKVKA